MPAPAKVEFATHHRAETRFTAPGKNLIITFDSDSFGDLALYEKVIEAISPLIRESGLRTASTPPG